MDNKEESLHGLLAKIEHHKDEIAKHRDALRDLASDIDEIVDSASRGIEELESAIDFLSETV